jgi:peptidoglycan LD-endopeptidase LytH
MRADRVALALCAALIVAGGVLVYTGATGLGTASSAHPPTLDDPAPADDDSTATQAEPTAPPAGTTGPPVYVFPVRGRFSYAHTHHDYPATDILSSCGTPVVAVTAGVVLELTRTDTWKASVNDGATRGGLSVSILGDDGVRYYGSHFSAIAPGIAAGVRVKAGQSIATVSKTGDTTACHVHFGISPTCGRTGDWWIRRGVVWPWPYLDSWRTTTSGQKSPVAEVAGWQKQHGCPAKAAVDP